MVTINRVYTRTGDDGTTGLVGGTRIKKNSLRVAAYGEVDELNAWVGWCRTEWEQVQNSLQVSAIAAQLEQIQHHLFDIGAELACPAGQLLPGMTSFGSLHATNLEPAIDSALEGLPVLKSFVLPGGSTLNSALHVARTVCRRAERSVLELGDVEPVGQPVVIYLNRLSDYLFAIARRASFEQGKAEFLWRQLPKGPQQD